MLSSKKKILVFLLSRSGCVPYAKGMLDNLEGVSTKIYVSRYATEKLPEKHIKISTYTNKINFLWNSLIVLPILFLKILKDIKNRYKIFYFPVFHHWNIFILIFGKVLGAKSIITIHDGILHEGENHWLHRWMQNYCLKKADHIIFLTSFVHHSVKERIPPSTPISIIPHGPIGNDFISPKTLSLQLPARLLFLGRIVKYKGLNLLLEAMPFLPPHLVKRLTVAGMLVNNELPRSLDNRVALQIGYQSEGQINDLLQSHDLLILPYRSATQSGIIPLGLSANIPMVVTNVGGLREQLSETEAVWVDPKPEAIAEGIKYILEHPTKWEQLKNKLKVKKDPISWQSCGKMLKDVIESV